MAQLTSLPFVPMAIASLVVLIGLALLGMGAVRALVPRGVLEPYHDVAGFIIAVVGVIYAVLLALIVIIVWEQFDSAEATTEKEAVALHSLYLDAAMFDPPGADQLRKQLREYAESIIADEWPSLADGHSSAKTDAALANVWAAYAAVEPHTPRATAFYAESTRRLNEVADLRQQRIFDSHGALPGVLWFGLLGAGAITVAFTYLFQLESARVQAVMTALLTALISVLLLMIVAMDRPYTGDYHVQPEAMQHVIEGFGG